jgi:(2Fe-2S) ferredoxin
MRGIKGPVAGRRSSSKGGIPSATERGVAQRLTHALEPSAAPLVIRVEALRPRDIFGRPIEQRRLVICTGPCCDRDGRAAENLAALHRLLLERGSDLASLGVGSCVRRNCLGKCRSEPLAHVMPDDVWYHDLSGEKLLRIYERHVLRSQPVDELILPEED